MKTIKLFINLAIMFSVYTVFIVPESEALHEVFRSMDLNQDEKIDREEFSEEMKTDAFRKIDSDTSGEITETEWMSLDSITIKEKHRALFQIMDKNNDKRITFFEFSAYSEEHSNIEEAFIGLDLDKDGALSPDEISSRPVFRMITIYF